MRRVTAGVIGMTAAASLSCFGPCLATAECCGGPSAVRMHGDDALHLDGAPAADTDGIEDPVPALVITLTGSEEGEVVREIDLLPDGAGGYVLEQADLGLEHQCAFDGTLRFELAFPFDWPGGGQDLEPVDYDFQAGFAGDDVELWNGWSVQVEILDWMA